MHVDVLGPVRLRVGGRVRGLRSRAQRCLVGLLAVRPGASVTRDTLVEALWGTRPPRDPRHALQAHVSRLRRALPRGPQLLAATPEGYELHADHVAVDAHAFVAAARAGRDDLRNDRPARAAATLDQALALWRGEPFGDVADLPHLATEALRLETLRLTALEDRIEADRRRGHDLPGLVAELEALLEAHPLRERLWSELMLAQDRTGRRADALTTYRRARDVLREQAGLDPGPDLQAVHARLLRDPGVEGTAPAPVPAAPPAPPAEAIRSSIGREAERGVLLQCWEQGHHGLQGALVAGPPGIGKSHLASEVAREVANRGGVVLVGHCDLELATPLHPLTEMLRAHLAAAPEDRPDEDDPLATLLPERLPDQPGPIGDHHVEQRRLLEAIAARLARLSTTSPLLLVVEDLQWADPATLAVLRHLVRGSTPGIRGLLLATHRDVAGPDGAVSAPDLGRDQQRIRRLTLDGLEPTALAEVFGDHLPPDAPTPLPTDLRRRLHHLTGGNPFLAIELARHLTHRGVDGSVTSIASALDEVPPTVREIVARTVAALTEDTREVLACAAVAGDTFDVRVVHGATRLADGVADVAIGTLVTHGLLAPPVDSGGRFAHGLVRAAVLDGIPPLRRLDLHDRVGQAIEDVHGPDLRGQHERLAHHFAAAGTDRERVATYAARAGHDALHQHAPARAVEHFDRAMAALGTTGPVDRRLDLLEWRGLARLRAGDPAHREDLLLVGNAAAEHDDVDRLVRMATLNSRGWNSRTTGIDAARVELLETALALLPDDGDDAARAQVLGTLAVEEVADPARRLAAIRRSRDAVAIARRTEDPRVLADALEHRHVVTFAAFHEPQRATATTAELLRVADTLRDPAMRMVADRCHAQASLLVGDLPTSDHHLRRAVRDAEAIDHPARIWLTRSWWALRLLTRGRLEEAEQEMLAAFELGRTSGQPDAMTWFGGQLFVLRDAQGRLGELVELLAERLHEDGAAMPTWRAGQALALCETGHHDDAVAILEALVDADGIALPDDLMWLVGVVHLARVAVRTHHHTAAAVLLDALAPHAGLIATNAVVGAGPVDTQIGALAALLGHRRLAESAFARAQRLCIAGDLPLWERELRRARETAVTT